MTAAGYDKKDEQFCFAVPLFAVLNTWRDF